jgi:hypothetical protein
MNPLSKELMRGAVYFIKQLTVYAFEHADILLAVLAIFFAVRQFWDARAHSKEIKDIALSMSTRFIGSFPANMSEVVDLTESAQSSLDILVDASDYGSYSAPEHFRNFMNSVMRKRGEKVVVRMLLYEEGLGHENCAEQFPEGKFEKTIKTPEYKRYFEEFNPGLKTPTSGEELLQIWFERARDYTHELEVSGVQVRYISERSVIFLWLKDRQDVVFSFTNADSTVDELAFRTRDGHLVNTFHRLFEKNWLAASQLNSSSVKRDADFDLKTSFFDKKH